MSWIFDIKCQQVTFNSSFRINGTEHQAVVTANVEYFDKRTGKVVYKVECESATDLFGNAIEDFDEQDADFYRKLEQQALQAFDDL